MKDAPLIQSAAPETSDHSLFQRISNPVFILSYPDAVIIQVNRAAAMLLGYTEDELLHVPLSDLVKDKTASLAPLLEELSRASDAEGTLTLIGRNGGTHALSVSLDLLPGESDTASIRLVARTAAAHPGAPDSSENRDGLIREALDAMPIFLWIYAPAEERFIYVSPAFERIYGYDHLRLYREPGLWFERHPPGRPGRHRQDLQGERGRLPGPPVPDHTEKGRRPLGVPSRVSDQG